MRALAVVVILGGVAWADDRAEALFGEGRQLLEAGSYAEACDKFTQSLQIEPESIGALLNLGLCNEQQDKLATALRWFRRAQLRGSEREGSEAEAAAKAKAVALAARVATVAIDAPIRPVTVDGVVVDALDIRHVELDAGHHVIAAGKLVQEVDLLDGDAKRIVLAPPPPPVRLPPIDGGARRHRAFVIGAAGGGVLVIGGAFALLAKHEFDGSEHPGVQAGWKDAARYVGTPLFVLGTAAVATAVWLYVTAPGERIVVPSVGDKSVGVSIAGSL
jgi:tetratricopeptide (TPR) repeat protein